MKCCDLEHVWFDNYNFYCDFCKVSKRYYKDSDQIKSLEIWNNEHVHNTPCPGDTTNHKLLNVDY